MRRLPTTPSIRTALELPRAPSFWIRARLQRPRPDGNRTMTTRLVLNSALCIAISISALSRSAAAQISIGQPFPAPSSIEWIKGPPLLEFERGRVYLVDFWATWCPPCMAMIPHTNDIARRYANRGVTVLGIAVLSDHGPVSPTLFVKEAGERMSYAVGEDTSGLYTNHVRTPSGAISLPTLVLIDREGRIAWKRHGFDLNGLEPALEQVLAGSWDLDQAVESQHRFAARKSEATQLVHRLAGPEESVASISHDLMELIRQEPRLGYLTAQALTQFRKPGQAYDFVEAVLSAVTVVNGLHLQDVAATLLGLDHGNPRGIELAYRAAAEADRLAGDEEPWIPQALAKVRFAQGDIEAAIAAQRRAIEVAKRQGWSQRSISAMTRRLDSYEKD